MKNYIKKGQITGQIMEINVNSSSTGSLLTGVEDFISHNHQFYIVTPNPELILMAQKDKKLKNALNSADLSIPDGVGLKIADPTLPIIKGRVLFTELISLAAKNNWKVFLLGGLDNEAKIAKLKIENSMENGKWKMEIESAKGPILDKEGEPLTEADINIEKEVINQINSFKPDLLFVAFGNPRQEIWIHENLSRLKVGGAMAVGGTLRYVAGMSKLPPKWMAEIGLEWLYRLVTEPRRIGRIFRAVIVFPLKYIIYSCSRP